MTWYGPALSEDQHDLAAVLDAFATEHEVVLTDDVTTVRRLIGALVELGVWTLGVPAERGGGGADWQTTAVVLAQIGRHWPALGLAATQAHVAAEMLSASDRFPELGHLVHTAEVLPAVIIEGSTHVRLTWDGDTLRGCVDRVDAAAETPALLALMTDGTALFVDTAALRTRPLDRTGLGGAFTGSIDVEASAEQISLLTEVDTSGARASFQMGIAAVAAGIASAATDAARTYAAGRHQFGAVLTAIPTVRQALLQNVIHTSVILATVLGASRHDPVSALASVHAACDGAIDIATSALQAHGGYGYLTEYPTERYLRDAVSLRAAANLPDASVAAAYGLTGTTPPGEHT